MRRPWLTSVLLFCAVVACYPATAVNAAAQDVTQAVAADTAPSLLTPALPQAGTGYAYDLQVSGTQTFIEPGMPAQKHDVRFTAGLELRWDARATDGSYPARINFVAPRLSVGGKERAWSTAQSHIYMARFDPSVQLVAAQTPADLAELGIDLTHLLLNLAMPLPPGPIGPGGNWQVRSVINGPGKGFDLRATYNLLRLEKRGGRNSALVSGSLQLVPRDQITRYSHVGRVEAYVDLATGRVLESAMSLQLEMNVTLPAAKTATSQEGIVRLLITTYLLNLGPASIDPPAATAPAKEEPAQQPVVPRVNVGQPKASEPAQQPTAPTPPADRAESGSADQFATAEPLPNYVDPAGRFALRLPTGWNPTPYRFTADTTAFAGPAAPQMLYVYVDAATSTSLNDFARSVLNEYAQTAPEYRLVSDLQPVNAGGVPAVAACYTYADANSRQPLAECAVFARYQGAQYIIQYTDNPAQLTSGGMTQAQQIVQSFLFGRAPTEPLAAAALAEGGFSAYADSAGSYTIDVPRLWPLFTRTEAVATFAELGKNGFLSIYAQTGMAHHAVENVLQAWRNQWARQRDYRELAALTPTRLGNLDALGLTYEWTNVDGKKWLRDVRAVISGDTYYAVVVDYLAAAAAERSAVFNHVFDSFRLAAPPTAEPAPAEEPPAVQEPEPAPEPPQPEPVVAEAPSVSDQPAAPSITSGGIITGPAQMGPLAPYRLDSPLGDRRAILAGRLGQLHSGGVQWLGGFTLRIRAGHSLYATRTDDQGYFAFANIAPLSSGSYVLEEARGQLLGFAQPVVISFKAVNIAAGPGRVIDAGQVLLTVNDDRSVAVKSMAPPTPGEALQHFITSYPDSGWTPVLQSALAEQ